MAGERILIVDDDPQIRLVIGDRLKANSFRISEAGDGAAALAAITARKPDLVLLDLKMPHIGGLEVLKRLQLEECDIPVVVLSAHGSIEDAVEAMKLGADDYLPKPCEPEHILLVIRKVLDRRGLLKQNRFLREELDTRYKMIVGNSPAMKQVVQLAEKVATSDTTILIQGESGTGKQLLAHYIHTMSGRNDHPMVQVTCTMLNEQLLESDLFGHEKGAFTGAVKQKQGRFELADKGTLFLDEIGDVAPAIQAKLLHAIEYREFQRVGGTETLRSDVRIITATNRDLKKEVEAGRFREDLFYRLNVMTIQLPPLRGRREDIPEFAVSFLEKHALNMQRQMQGITKEALRQLSAYSWPGNIRELDNVIQRAVVLSAGSEIDADALPPLENRRDIDGYSGLTLEHAQLTFKKRFLTDTLKSVDFNQTEAAKVLGIQRTYLNRLVKDLGIGQE